MEAKKVIEIARSVRVKIQTAINSVQALGEQSSRTASATSSLEYSRAWLGRLMGELGSPDPYLESKNAASLATESLADYTETVLPMSGERIADVKTLRAYIDDIFIAHRELPRYETTDYSIALRQSLVELRQAQFALGFELGRILDTQPSTPNA